MKIIVASTTGTTVKKPVPMSETDKLLGVEQVFDYILIPTFTATVFLSQEQDASEFKNMTLKNYERVALAVAKRRLGDVSIYPKAIILTDRENEWLRFNSEHVKEVA